MSEHDPFRAVHRARRRRTLGLTLTGAVAASALAAFAWLLPAAVANPTLGSTSAAVAVAAGAEPGSAPAAGSPAAATAGESVRAPLDQPTTAQTTGSVSAIPARHAAVLPAAAPSTGAPMLATPPEATPPEATPATPRDHTITVDTDGYQAELDRCLWVRMDLAGASAPIVGAHNNCGGEVVLDLVPGDLVTLSGQSVDGRYVVADSRDGRPGQDAAEATSGFTASVILQTCYFDGPDVRLVALVRVV